MYICIIYTFVHIETSKQNTIIKYVKYLKIINTMYLIHST